MMSAAQDFAATAPFEVRSPARQLAPFVFNSPHSGSFYPPRFLAMSRLDRLAIRMSEDCYVDTLFADVVALGAPLLAARFPRAYLDVNREPWELDPRMFTEPLPAHFNARSLRVAGGLGTVPRLVGEGQEIYAQKLALAEAVSRVETIYEPYHACLRALLTATQASFGQAVLIDCHSMPGPASIRSGERGMRPDFIVGDRFGLSCSPVLAQGALGALSGMGYKVAHNKPYAGGFITEHYGRPACRLHALQIEINRSLYMNERTLRRTAGFEALREDLTRFAAAMIGLTEGLSDGLPLAAE